MFRRAPRIVIGAGPQGVSVGVDIEEAVERRKRALELAIDVRSRNGVAETATVTVERAAEFDRFLEGAPPSASAPTAVLAVQGAEHVALRTRANAIDAVEAHMRAHEAQAWPSRREHAAAIVAAIMAVDD